MSAVFPWFVRAKIVHGHGRGGSQLGFPTANLDLTSDIIEQLKQFRNGVYFGWGLVEPGPEAATAGPAIGQVLPIVFSLGNNPQFKDKDVSLEAYFMHKFASDFYGATVRVFCCGFLREMAAFKSLELLIEMIAKDVEDGKALLEKEPHADFRAHPLVASVKSDGNQSAGAVLFHPEDIRNHARL